MQKFSYFGYKVISEDDEQLSNLYSDKTINWYDLVENQYLVVVDGDGNDVDRFKWQDGKHKSVVSKTVESIALGKLKAKNSEQILGIDALLDPSTTVKAITGPFGAGKDFLMAACSFYMLQQNQFEKIMWVRNNVEVKNSNPIGHLKGTMYEKLVEYAMPLADHIGGRNALEMYVQSGKIEIEHLGFLRGRDIKNTIVLCSEAEHLTREHVQLLLGRISQGSILMLNGDWRQIDSKVFEQNNGLQIAIDRIKGNRLFSYVHLPTTVRSETARLADLLD